MDLPRRASHLVYIAVILGTIALYTLGTSLQSARGNPPIEPDLELELQSRPASGSSDFIAPAISFSDTIKRYPPPSSTPSVLIFQHIPHFTPLYRASYATHKLYAQAWGYHYRYMSGGKVGPEDERKKAPSMNKMYVLRDVMEEQLRTNDGERVDWIFDPAVPLHLLLPQSSLSPLPEPLFLASQDHNGFNAGVMLFKVDATILSLVQWTIERFESTPNKGDGWAPSDQVLLAQGLEQIPDLAQHFYEIPRLWVNAYYLHDTDDDGDIPQLQVHLVNRLKLQYRFTPIVKHNMDVLQRAAEEMDREGGMVGVYSHGLDLLPSFVKAEQAGRTFWSGASGGIANMRFLWD